MSSSNWVNIKIKRQWSCWNWERKRSYKSKNDQPSGIVECSGNYHDDKRTRCRILLDYMILLNCTERRLSLKVLFVKLVNWETQHFKKRKKKNIRHLIIRWTHKILQQRQFSNLPRLICVNADRNINNVSKALQLIISYCNEATVQIYCMQNSRSSFFHWPLPFSTNCLLTSCCGPSLRAFFKLCRTPSRCGFFEQLTNRRRPKSCITQWNSGKNRKLRFLRLFLVICVRQMCKWTGQKRIINS